MSRTAALEIQDEDVLRSLSRGDDFGWRPLRLETTEIMTHETKASFCGDLVSWIAA